MGRDFSFTGNLPRNGVRWEIEHGAWDIPSRHYCFNHYKVIKTTNKHLYRAITKLGFLSRELFNRGGSHVFTNGLDRPQVQ